MSLFIFTEMTHGIIPHFVGSLNEGTYVTNVIVPAIRASLKDLPFGRMAFVSS